MNSENASGSGETRRVEDDLKSDHSKTPTKRRKKQSTTLDSILSFKSAVLQVAIVCTNTVLIENPDVKQLQQLERLLTFSIEELEASSKSVQEEKKNKKIFGFPDEIHSPYKNDRVCKQSIIPNVDDVLKDFVREYTFFMHAAADIIHSDDSRAILKLLAIQRTYDSRIPLLKANKEMIGKRIELIKKSNGSSN